MELIVAQGRSLIHQFRPGCREEPFGYSTALKRPAHLFCIVADDEHTEICTDGAKVSGWGIVTEAECDPGI